jgi:ABC-type uncharacterized transport system substrate-binding protein
VERFQASVDPQGRLLFLYQFFVPLRSALAASAQTVGVSIYDESFFVDIRYADLDPLRIEGAPSLKYAVDLVTQPGSAYWGGTIVAKEIRLRIGGTP